MVAPLCSVGLKKEEMPAFADYESVDDAAEEIPQESKEAVQKPTETASKPQPALQKEIVVLVNTTPVVLRGKSEYKVVDILDVYPFDLTVVGGTEVVLKQNGEKTDFARPLYENDEILLYWEK